MIHSLIMSLFGGFLVAIVGWRSLSNCRFFARGVLLLSLLFLSSTHTHITRIQIDVVKGTFSSPSSRQTSSATATQLGRRGSPDHGQNLLPQRFRRGTLATANAGRGRRRGITGRGHGSSGGEG